MLLSPKKIWLKKNEFLRTIQELLGHKFIDLNQQTKDRLCCYDTKIGFQS